MNRNTDCDSDLLALHQFLMNVLQMTSDCLSVKVLLEEWRLVKVGRHINICGTASSYRSDGLVSTNESHFQSDLQGVCVNVKDDCTDMLGCTDSLLGDAIWSFIIAQRQPHNPITLLSLLRKPMRAVN